MKTQNLTVDRLRQLLDYDAVTGLFVWKVGQRAGRQAGTKHWAGYLFIKIDQVVYLAHRLAWLHVHGVWPADLDHKNLNKADNRITNLRECDDSTNQANCTMRPTNTSGRKGVTWNRKCGKWQAGIKRQGRSVHLGLFVDLDDAAAAYAVAAESYFGQFARAA